MLFRKLRLSGFKSFVEPAELRIEPGLTGVVGPNGCGKSNLLEAIRWVMGENSPKSLRSGGMDDVIFAGTAQRPPRDFAEVVLHASDSLGEELEVTRRIERGAGSAYRVNGRDVRAKDVALVFADAATGAHSPALVSQGKIAAVIAAKPAERRSMLEEAAGISGLHVRRRDAESKLRQTETNLARLEDIMAGLDTQMASLRRQAKQAERYKALSAKIQLAEARLLEDLARAGGDEMNGALRLGAIYTVAPYLLPGLVPWLRQRAPLMPLVIEENFTSRLLEQLRDNDLDAAILALPVDMQGLSAWPLYDEEFVAVLPADHRWAADKQIVSKKLAEEKLLLLGPGHCFRDQVISACPKCVDPDRDGPQPLTGSSLETIRHMVVSGLGITVLPRGSTDNREDKNGLLVTKPLQPAPSRRIALVWRKSFPRPKAIAALRDAVLHSGMKGVSYLKDAAQL